MTPRTMTAERLAQIRPYVEGFSSVGKEFVAEFDAEVAAHQETQAQRDSAERLLVSAVELDRKTQAQLVEAQAISCDLIWALLTIIDIRRGHAAEGGPCDGRCECCSECIARSAVAKARGVLPAALPDKTGDQ